ncbi:calcium-binding protein [Cyanobium sp. WKJ7-Wakatipu]|uniref:calcium-binding protein n=1 Tax=Cyanobium sp. WKJ7-Wakatipu TaxID=2823726 RepID=UPI0020CF728E|nr:calcium-binding protein [Cyanobium sp. WKJ7-Wakatipu]MCP9783258.1 calcium-binding protein [Cyanobium sp. WKJ7-Wakatipu]
MATLSGNWYSKNGTNLADGAVLKRTNIDKNDRIRIDNLGLVFYDIDGDWLLGTEDILIGSLVYTSSLAKTSGVFNQDPDNPSSFFFGADTADQPRGLLVIFNEKFLKGLSLDPPPPVIPQPVKPAASVIKSSLEATVKSQADIRDYISNNLTPAETVSSSIASVELKQDSPPNVVLMGSADLGVSGNAAENVLVGNDGSNTLDGGLGNDIMLGGKGDDFYYIDSPDDAVIELRAEGRDTVITGISYALPDQVENLVLVGSATRGSGNGMDNVITGNDLVNYLYGLGGNDVLDGQGGGDFLVGGFGNDTYIIDSLEDSIEERFNAGDDTARIRIKGLGLYKLPKHVEAAVLEDGISFSVNGNELPNSILGNSLNNTLLGLMGDDYLSGLEGSDLLIGGLGNDFIDGGLGDDLLEGGLGNDHYVVDSGSDSVVELIAQGQDLVRATSDYLLPANVETLLLAGVANISGMGNSLNNLIQGNKGNNVLDGGGGVDTLIGSSGSDMFVFSTLSSFSVSRADRISDFTSGEDTIRIGAKSLGVESTNGFTFAAVQGFSALTTALRTPTSIVYDSSTGYLYWNQNESLAGSGEGGIFAVINKDKNPALVANGDVSFF